MIKVKLCFDGFSNSNQSIVLCSDDERVDSSVDMNEHPLISTKKLLTLKLIAFLVVFFFKIFGESFLSLLQQAEKCLLFFLIINSKFL